jgi:hypothetical protein
MNQTKPNVDQDIGHTYCGAETQPWPGCGTNCAVTNELENYNEKHHKEYMVFHQM